LETTLNAPDFHAIRSREAHGLIADLEAAKADVTRSYERWKELAAPAMSNPAASAAWLHVVPWQRDWPATAH